MVLPEIALQRARKRLSTDALYILLRCRFENIPDSRAGLATISLADALMSAFAMFSLKDPSLLTYDGRRNDENIKRLFHVGTIPSDTQMREILDPVTPASVRPAFNDIFRELQRGKALEKYVFHKGSYLLCLDGTGYFSSQKIHCPSCLEKVSKTGETTYSHQLLGAALVHPDRREVIPFAPEPIIKQDGENKNDCERNASRRLLQQIRREHPHLNPVQSLTFLLRTHLHVHQDLVARATQLCQMISCSAHLAERPCLTEGALLLFRPGLFRLHIFQRPVEAVDAFGLTRWTSCGRCSD